MDVGIGLPNAVLDVQGPELVEWARRADQRGFSVLGTIGRVAFPSYEELVTLAAAAAVTERIELMTTVLVAPPRQAVLLAKQAASLHAISGGRFRLGLGMGGRDDDWRALGAEPTRKAAALDAAIATCRSVWSGAAPDGAGLPVSPPAPDLPLVLGGYSEPAFRRAGRSADAFIAAPMPPGAIAAAYATVTAAAAEVGRPAPRLYAARYVAIGQDVAAEADRNAATYYGFGGDELVEMVRSGILRSAADVRETMEGLREVGVSELCLWPFVRGIDQVERVADAAL